MLAAGMKTSSSTAWVALLLLGSALACAALPGR